MKLDKIIAESKNKKIYLDKDKVIKVFNDCYSQADVLQEALNQTIICDLGIPAPKVIEVCKIENNWAIVSEYVSGDTLTHVMRNNPDRVDELMDRFTSLQVEVLSKKSYKLVSQKGKINDAIAILDLDAITRFALHEKINSMHNHNEVCHGDFVPSNVMLTNDDKLVILDWARVNYGNPLIDIVTSYIQIKTHMQNEQLAEKYLEGMINKTKYEKEDIEKWIPVVLAFLSAKENNKELSKKFLDLYLNIK